jgi:hypothetical protein
MRSCANANGKPMTDSKDKEPTPRIHAMDAREFNEKCLSLWPLNHWKHRIAEVLDVDYSTICKYANGKRPIPNNIAIAIDMLVRVYKVTKAGKLKKRKGV